jgi:hypothetical protein
LERTNPTQYSSGKIVFQSQLAKSLHFIMKDSIIRLLVFLVISLTTTAPANLYAQCRSGNCANGNGLFRFTNGDTYNGTWYNNQPNGKGIYLFSSKERYEGEFVKGKFEGQGIMHYPDGVRYIGGWRNNRKHGQGKLVATDGRIIREGQWNNGEFSATPSGGGQPVTQTTRPTNTVTPDKPAANRNQITGLTNCASTYCRSGRGYYDYPDGSRWVGEFKDGLPFGRGICHYANGDRYDGQWQHNAPYGEGVMYFASGRAYGAVWVNGSPVRELDSRESVPTSTVQVEQSNSIRIRAVVVGVSNYTSMPSLRFTDDDASRYYAFLKSPEGGGLPDDRVELLLDPTRVEMLNALRKTFLKADENDMVVLYFSGHGLDGCFLPADYDGYNNKVRHEEIKTIFKQSKAKYKLCIADACHSGSLNAGLAAKGPTPANMLSRYYRALEDSDGGIALFMSSKSEELSLEDHGLRQGVFTYYLLSGLKGEADTDRNGLVTIRELFLHVSSRVREYTAGAQTPVLTGDYDDNLPVGVTRR